MDSICIQKATACSLDLLYVSDLPDWLQQQPPASTSDLHQNQKRFSVRGSTLEFSKTVLHGAEAVLQATFHFHPSC